MSEPKIHYNAESYKSNRTVKLAYHIHRRFQLRLDSLLSKLRNALSTAGGVWFVIKIIKCTVCIAYRQVSKRLPFLIGKLWDYYEYESIILFIQFLVLNWIESFVLTPSIYSLNLKIVSILDCIGSVLLGNALCDANICEIRDFSFEFKSGL